MPKLPERVTSVGEFLELVPRIRKEFDFAKDDPWNPWYRGQRADQDLRPTLFRNHGYAQIRDDNLEDEIREEFNVRAPVLSEFPLTIGDDEWERYFLMQHYGAPTRLLDWTEGALIGLYFAVKDSAGLRDAAVWVLGPYTLNKDAIGKYEIIPPAAVGLHKRDRKLVDPWLPKRFTGMRGLHHRPLAIYPTHIARRISTQRSCFTVHGTDMRGLDRLANKKPYRLIRTLIPSYAIASIRRELEACGIDEATIFPDLQGLGRSLSVKWHPGGDQLPHEGVVTRLRPSQVHHGGVGVFAIRSIKKGAPLFERDNDEMLWVDEKKALKVSKETRALYADFVVRKEERLGCPVSFNRLTVSWYLNEPAKGQTPNVRCDPITYDFYALRNIKAGEELTVDYRTYSDLPILRLQSPKGLKDTAGLRSTSKRKRRFD